MNRFFSVNIPNELLRLLCIRRAASVNIFSLSNFSALNKVARGFPEALPKFFLKPFLEPYFMQESVAKAAKGEKT